MKYRLVGTIVCIMLITTFVFPVVGNVNKDNELIENKQSIEFKHQNVQSSADDEWPKFRHDLNNTGYSSSYAPQTKTRKWIFMGGRGGCESSPAIVNGKVYIGHDDEYFYCLNADTGEVIWRFFIGGGTSGCSPAVYKDKVYVGTVYDYIHCRNATTGEVIWTVEKPYGSCSSPAISNGCVYIARSRGEIYCLDADTGSEIWKYDIGNNEVSSPAIYDEKVYIGLENRSLYCFNANTGEVLWIKESCGGLASPAIFDGKIISGGNGVFCLNAENGSIIWDYFNTTTYSSPAIAYGKIYLVGKSGEAGVHCIDATTGKKIWYFHTSSFEHCFSSPAVADGRVYVGIWSSGKLICLDAYTGDFIWDYKTASPQWLFNSPAIAYGRVYIGGGLTNRVICFEDPSKPPSDPIINGPTECLLQHKHKYSFTSIDPENEHIEYFVDWGDGTDTGWIGPYQSGKQIPLNHVWKEIGDYTIRVITKDLYGIQSHWSEQTIIVIDAPALKIESISGSLMNIKSTIRNYGSLEAINVNWNITIDGGFIPLGRKSTGIITNIPVGEERTITSKFTFGFGTIAVSVNVAFSNGLSDSKERTGSVFLFFIKFDTSG
jgi:outer membrane protein assembly factor BamB